MENVKDIVVGDLPLSRAAVLLQYVLNLLCPNENKAHAEIEVEVVKKLKELCLYDHTKFYGGTSGPNKFDHLVLQTPKYPRIKELAKRLEKSFWHANTIDPSQDLGDFAALSEAEQHSLKVVLAFFAIADTLVKEVINNLFVHEFPLPECSDFFAQQVINEAVHQEVYNNFLETYVTDKEELNQLLHAYSDVTKFAAVKRKVDWLNSIMSPENCSIGEKVVAQIAVEGINFSSSFALLLRFKDTMKQLKTGNMYIRRDESLHCEFYITLWKLMPNKPSNERTREILMQAVEIELMFVELALPTDLSNVPQEQLKDHVRATANMWFEVMGLEPPYLRLTGCLDEQGRDIYEPLRTPLLFMNKYDNHAKTNFFELHETAYQVDTKRLNFNRCLENKIPTKDGTFYDVYYEDSDLDIDSSSSENQSTDEEDGEDAS